MITGERFAEQAVKGGYIGIPYQVLDCQGFVERVMRDCGIRKPDGTCYDWRGSNSMYRNYMSWRGTINDCMIKFGMIPQGALLFTRKTDGGEVEKGYNDSLGNFAHVGIYITDGARGVIHSTTGGVQWGKFPDKRWTNAALPAMIDYTGKNNDTDISGIINSIREKLNELERMVQS